MRKLLFLVMLGIACLGEQELAVSAKVNKDMSSTYFAYIDFNFENKSEEWVLLENLEISFGEKVDEYINFPLGNKYNSWLEAITIRNKEREANRQVTLALIGTLGGMIAMNGNQDAGLSLVAAAGSVESIRQFANHISQEKRAALLPENHLLREAIMVPPGLQIKKFIVVNSRNHKEIGYLRTLNLSYLSAGIKSKATLSIRDEQYATDQNNVPGSFSKQKNYYVWQNDI
ncbi:MAG: hypothetical protein AB7E49_04415 [Campylobacterales bacterium]